MKMKKQMLCLALAGMTLLGIAACGQSTEETAGIVDTETVTNDLAANKAVIETVNLSPIFILPFFLWK